MIPVPAPKPRLAACAAASCAARAPSAVAELIVLHEVQEDPGAWGPT